MEQSLEQRKAILDAVRQVSRDNAEEFSRRARAATETAPAGSEPRRGGASAAGGRRGTKTQPAGRRTSQEGGLRESKSAHAIGQSKGL